MTNNPLINASELLEIIDRSNVVIIDARSGEIGKTNYLKSHIVGALHVRLNEDLSDIKADLSDGGRHPLPSPQQFGNLLGQLGITPDSHVVVYDDKGGANAASRFWWMMTALGHDKIQVLDGGFQAAIDRGISMSEGVEHSIIGPDYPSNAWALPISDIEEVVSGAERDEDKVIDVRAAYRYNGESEPIDPIAGHIPGAINIPFSTNLAEDGSFKSSDQLKMKYEEITEGRSNNNVIVHCGSGVTACHTILAMKVAGMDIPKLYVGSWSEWCRRRKEIGTNL